MVNSKAQDKVLKAAVLVVAGRFHCSVLDLRECLREPSPRWGLLSME